VAYHHLGLSRVPYTFPDNSSVPSPGNDLAERASYSPASEKSSALPPMPPNVVCRQLLGLTWCNCACGVATSQPCGYLFFFSDGRLVDCVPQRKLVVQLCRPRLAPS
jgi:hypothetical protein